MAGRGRWGRVRGGWPIGGVVSGAGSGVSAWVGVPFFDCFSWGGGDMDGIWDWGMGDGGWVGLGWAWCVFRAWRVVGAYEGGEMGGGRG